MVGVVVGFQEWGEGVRHARGWRRKSGMEGNGKVAGDESEIGEYCGGGAWEDLWRSCGSSAGQWRWRLLNGGGGGARSAVAVAA